MGRTRMIVLQAGATLLLLTLVGCGDNDRPPQEAFVLQNNTEWNIFIVSGRLGETEEIAFADGRDYTPRIPAGSAYRKTYAQSPDGKPGGCFGNFQMWAVRSVSDALDQPGINDIVDVDDLEVLAYWAPDTCFERDDQLVTLTG